jgi:hypothetical protein
MRKAASRKGKKPPGGDGRRWGGDGEAMGKLNRAACSPRQSKYVTPTRTLGPWSLGYELLMGSHADRQCGKSIDVVDCDMVMILGFAC